MQPIVTDRVASSVGWSICDSREPCKNRSIEMPFGLCTLVDVRKPVLDGGVHIGATWQI